MKCKDVRRWLIDLSDKTLEEDRLSEIEEHVAQCEECARFEEDLKKIRHLLEQTKTPAPSEDLCRRTQTLCHKALKSAGTAESGFLDRIKAASIPAYIWMAFAALTVITVIVILPLLKELASDDLLSLQAILTLSFMIQNAIMLFLAPLILQKYRRKSQDFRMTEYVNNA